jgi:dTDP-4-dehydrorhamnose 3,5-epimerase
MAIDGVQIFEEDFFRDDRGLTYTTYKKEWCPQEFILDKVIEGPRKALRGFHADKHTWKLFTCLKGKFVLCLVDLRENFGQKEIFVLSKRNRRSILVPPGVANAHQGLSSYILFYKWDRPYNINEQVTVAWNDPGVGMKWPYKPILSERDKKGIKLKDFKWNV